MATMLKTAQITLSSWQRFSVAGQKCAVAGIGLPEVPYVDFRHNSLEQETAVGPGG